MLNEWRDKEKTIDDPAELKTLDDTMEKNIHEFIRPLVQFKKFADEAIKSLNHCKSLQTTIRATISREFVNIIETKQPITSTIHLYNLLLDHYQKMPDHLSNTLYSSSGKAALGRLLLNSQYQKLYKEYTSNMHQTMYPTVSK